MVPYLFYGFVLLVPFGSYRALGGALNFVRLHWIFSIMLAFFVVMRMLIQRRLPVALRHGRMPILLTVFYVINLLAALGSRVPSTSSKFMLLLAAGFLLVLLGMAVIERKGFARDLPAVLVGSVFASSLLAVVGYLFDLRLFQFRLSGRAVGGSPEPNNMSLMIIYTLPLAVYFLLTCRRAWVRLALLLLIGVDVAAVVVTFSRGGAVILSLATVLILWEYRRLIAPRNLGLLLGLGGIVLAVLVTLTPEAYVERVRSLRDFDDFALRRRASYVVASRELVAERPLLGSGPDSFAPLYAETDIGQHFWRQHKSQSPKRDAHNTYVEVLVGSGVVGLGAFLLLLGYTLYSFSLARRRFLAVGDMQMALLTVAYRASFVTLLIYLVIYSGVLHKYLLVSLVMSQVALRLADSRFMALAQEPADA